MRSAVSYRIIMFTGVYDTLDLSVYTDFDDKKVCKTAYDDIIAHP